jgi:hypothetical protein
MEKQEVVLKRERERERERERKEIDTAHWRKSFGATKGVG